MDDVSEAVEGAVSAFYTAWQVPINIIVIIVIAVLLNWALRLLLRRTVLRVVHGVKKSKAVEDTAELATTPHVAARAVQRTRTLGTVGRHVISWTVVVISLILMLGQLGVNLGALLTSAGIVAAGLAFGAQNIVKDILNGIFMVFEDQLGVGDAVTIGDVSGTVEDVGIRVTQVRAIDGTLWFIRNGEILTLGNASQGWGRALIDIAVDASTDLDEVQRVALLAANELTRTPESARKITGEPEVWGIESAFGDRATIRLAVRTRPEAQWAVQRSLRQILMRKFTEAGIQLATELPNPGGKS